VTPAPRKPPVRKSRAKKPATSAAEQPSSAPPAAQPAAEPPPAFVPAPATPAAVATPVPVEASRPNLLDTGLSDYGMWVEIVKSMSAPPETPGERAGRIWS